MSERRGAPRRFEAEQGALNDKAIRQQAASTLSSLIESLAIVRARRDRRPRWWR